jgi:hypothetical protein
MFYGEKSNGPEKAVQGDLCLRVDPDDVADAAPGS